MQLLVAVIKKKTTASNILCKKFLLALQIFFHFFLHVINVTAELTCHQCRGISCLRTSYEATQTCLNDLDICVNVFDKQTLLAQGCYEQLSEEFRYKCDSKANIITSKELDECFKCNENLCNNISSSSFECIQCDSDKNKNCLINPLSLRPSRCDVSRTPNEYCFVKKEGGRVTRGCLYNLNEQMSCLNSDDCTICQPSELSACNNIELEIEESGSGANNNNDEGSKEDFGQGNDRICHQCSGINCLRTSYAVTQKCLNNVDICVTIFDDQTVLAQGCWEQLPEEVRSKCDNQSQCLKCNENLCNSIASESFECVQCDSNNDDTCRINPLNLVPSRCNISRTPNEYCFVKQDGKRVIRGCSYTLHEQISCLLSDNCMICLPSEIHGCNNVEVITDDYNGSNEETNGSTASDNGSEGSGSDDNSNVGTTEKIPSGSGGSPEANESNSNSSDQGSNHDNNESSNESGNEGSENGLNGCDTKTLNIFVFVNIITLFLFNVADNAYFFLNLILSPLIPFSRLLQI